MRSIEWMKKAVRDSRASLVSSLKYRSVWKQRRMSFRRSKRNYHWDSVKWRVRLSSCVRDCLRSPLKLRDSKAEKHNCSSKWYVSTNSCLCFTRRSSSSPKRTPSWPLNSHKFKDSPLSRTARSRSWRKCLTRRKLSLQTHSNKRRQLYLTSKWNT